MNLETQKRSSNGKEFSKEFYIISTFLSDEKTIENLHDKLHWRYAKTDNTEEMYRQKVKTASTVLRFNDGLESLFLTSHRNAQEPIVQVSK